VYCLFYGAFFNGNVPTIDGKRIIQRDLRDDADSINNQEVTPMPLRVEVNSQGTPTIRAKDPRYATPGPDESQKFPHDAAASKATPPVGVAV
jgi:arylsulfatase